MSQSKSQMPGNMSNSLGPLLAILVFSLLVLSPVTTRDPIFNDELINLARTQHGFASLTANIFDYSLRPLYRIFNQVARVLFGPSLAGLWLGGGVVAIVGAGILQVMARRFGLPLPIVAAPFFLLTTPLFVTAGLGAMPQLVAGVVALGSLFFLVRWFSARVAPLANDRGARRDALLAVGLGTAALLTHPAQLAFIVAIFGVFGLVALINFASEGPSNGTRTRRVIVDIFWAAATFALLIGVVEFLYRATVFNIPNVRLLPGYGYSYINLWIGNIAAFDTHLASYAKSPTFYLELLADQKYFSAASSLLFVFAAFITYRNRSLGRFEMSDLAVFVPFLVFVIWLTISSLGKMKTQYTIVSGMPLAAASNTLLFGYVVVRTRITKNGRQIASTGMAALLSMMVIVDYVKSRRDLARAGLRSAPDLAQPYALFHGLPPGPVGIIAATATPKGAVGTHAAAARDKKLERGCRTLALATQRKVSRLDSESLKTAELMEKSLRPNYQILCILPGAWVTRPVSSDALQQFSGFLNVMTSKSGIEFWVRSLP